MAVLIFSTLSFMCGYFSGILICQSDHILPYKIYEYMNDSQVETFEEMYNNGILKHTLKNVLIHRNITHDLDRQIQKYKESKIIR